VIRSRFVFRPLGPVLSFAFGNQALHLPSQKPFRSISNRPLRGRWFGVYLLALCCFASGTYARAARRSPKLTVSATTMSFGSVNVNSSKTLSLTLSSSGSEAVTVKSASISGTGFSIVSGSLPATLSPNQQLTLQVQFAPTASGSDTGSLKISSNSTSGSTTSVSLSGTGAAATTAQLSFSASTLSFGSVTVNFSGTQSLTLRSSGTAAVTLNSASVSGTGFSLIGASLPATLNSGQSLTLQVQFAPMASGSDTGSLTISSNSATGSTTAVALSGTGTAAKPQLTVSATSLSFGSVTLNTATTQSLTLTSTGTTPVTVSSAAISGASFTLVGGGFPVTMNPTQTLTLQLQFDPTTAGALTGQLTISSNATTGSSAVVSLSGTGTAVAHQVNLNWDAPASSPEPVMGYNIYRSTGTGSFVLINSSPDTAATYVDNTVVGGTSYNYQVTSVDSSGMESVPTSPITVAIP
jgi:hypothetical protein